VQGHGSTPNPHEVQPHAPGALCCAVTRDVPSNAWSFHALAQLPRTCHFLPTVPTAPTVTCTPPPGVQPGLTLVQSLLFFEAAAHHWLAISTIFMALVPIIYLFCALSPMIVSALVLHAVLYCAVL